MTSKPVRYRIYEVTLLHMGSSTITARSPAAAKADAWRSDIFHDVSFGEFLKRYKPKVRVIAPGLVQDGYAYVRRNYNLPVKIGDRVRIKNEGQLSGSMGTVLYPGPSTAHVHVLIDGREHPSHVHPYSVDIIKDEAAPPPTDTPAPAPASPGAP